ncbi:MAG: RNA polymerase sigma factor [Patescibacteria group bacterium]
MAPEFLLKDASDEDIAARVQKGEETALGELISRYEEKLTRYGRRFLVGHGDDAVRQAVQDVFISVYQNIEGFNTRQRFSPWIYRIAHNAFIDILRQTMKQPIYGIDLDTLVSHTAYEDGYADEKEKEQIRVLVENGLKSLRAAEREILVLYYFEELSYKEIADVLHIPVSTAGVRLARARARLKGALPDSSHLTL